MQPLLAVDELIVSTGTTRLVDGVSFEVNEGETVCLVGESGCGKSLTCLSAMRLLDPRLHAGGEIRLFGQPTSTLAESALAQIRGRDVAMIFQNPVASLNPIQRVGKQIADTLMRHEGLGFEAAKQRTIELLERVGISDPAGRFSAYPHELSGGMCQRVMIAMAIACRPRLLLADEPTTALDVTIQAQIVELLKDLQRQTGMGLVFVTHDFGVVAEIADRVAVMYAGRIVETAPVEDLFRRPSHPYTRALMQCRMRADRRSGRLAAIEGTVPQASSRPPGCSFAPRCPQARPACARMPPRIELGPQSFVVCHAAQDDALA